MSTAPTPITGPVPIDATTHGGLFVDTVTQPTINLNHFPADSKEPWAMWKGVDEGLADCQTEDPPGMVDVAETLQLQQNPKRNAVDLPAPCTLRVGFTDGNAALAIIPDPTPTDITVANECVQLACPTVQSNVTTEVALLTDDGTATAPCDVLLDTNVNTATVAEEIAIFTDDDDMGDRTGGTGEALPAECPPDPELPVFPPCPPTGPAPTERDCILPDALPSQTQDSPPMSPDFNLLHADKGHVISGLAAAYVVASLREQMETGHPEMLRRIMRDLQIMMGSVVRTGWTQSSTMDDNDLIGMISRESVSPDCPSGAKTHCLSAFQTVSPANRNSMLGVISKEIPWFLNSEDGIRIRNEITTQLISSWPWSLIWAMRRGLGTPTMRIGTTTLCCA